MLERTGAACSGGGSVSLRESTQQRKNAPSEVEAIKSKCKEIL